MPTTLTKISSLCVIGAALLASPLAVTAQQAQPKAQQAQPAAAPKAGAQARAGEAVTVQRAATASTASGTPARTLPVEVKKDEAGCGHAKASDA